MIEIIGELMDDDFFLFTSIQYRLVTFTEGQSSSIL